VKRFLAAFLRRFRPPVKVAVRQVLNERIAEAEQGFAEDQAYLEKRTAEQIAELHYRLEAERGTALRLRVKSVLAS
jgi:hypothetical protein